MCVFDFSTPAPAGFSLPILLLIFLMGVIPQVAPILPDYCYIYLQIVYMIHTFTLHKDVILAPRTATHH